MKIIKSTLAIIALGISFTASASSWRDAIDLVQKARDVQQEIAPQVKIPQFQSQPNEVQRPAKQDNNCMENVRIGMPSEASSSNVFVCHEGYAVLFNTKLKTPVWVSEQLTANEIFGNAERSPQFTSDPSVSPRFQASRKDYSRSGWDQGHMAPAADFSQNQRLMDESFFYTNIVPQNPDHNRKFWSALEKKVRTWVSHRQQLYVITGPVYNGNKPNTIGNGVAIPDGIFKVVYDPRTNTSLAILSPNVSLTERDLSKYLVSVREVEKATGLNFMSALPQNVQDATETRRSGMWTR